MTVDDAPPAVSLPARVLSALYEHALECAAQGEECCGLVVADEQQHFATVVRCRNVMTKMHDDNADEWPRDNRTAYYMHPEDLREWVAPGVSDRVAAVYHSHVGVGAYLSGEDLAYVENALFPFPHADQIVLSVIGENVQAAQLFRRVGVGAPFVGTRIEAEHS